MDVGVGVKTGTENFQVSFVFSLTWMTKSHIMVVHPYTPTPKKQNNKP